MQAAIQYPDNNYLNVVSVCQLRIFGTNHAKHFGYHQKSVALKIPLKLIFWITAVCRLKHKRII
jgi:hypothetical protein